MNNLSGIGIWWPMALALVTALLAWLGLWLAASRQGRRLRRWLDRSWQPVFLQPYRPAPPRERAP